MEGAKDILHYSISKQSLEYILSFLPNNYSGRLTIIFPLQFHSGIHIAVFDDKHPSVKTKVILTGYRNENNLYYLLQVDKNTPLMHYHLLEYFIVGERISECDEEESVAISKLLKKLLQKENKYCHKPLGQLYVKILLQYLLEMLSKNEEFSTREEELAKKFLVLVKLERLPNHHVRYYAEKLFVSRRYLTLSVQKALGRTPKNIIDSQITDIAKELLHTINTIYSVAELLQFDSPASFSSFFKKNTGIAPSEYRKQIK